MHSSSLPAATDNQPWLDMFAMPIGDHRRIVVEVRSRAGTRAEAYWTGSFWAHAPVTDHPRPLRFQPVAQRPIGPVEQTPAHLNFTVADWFKLRTELPRQPSGWTPVTTLYADYLEWCSYTDVPYLDVLPQSDFEAQLRTRDDRAPEMMLVEKRAPYAAIGTKRPELCYPRHLRPAIRVTQ